MRWIKFCGAVLAAMSMANLADAGFCGLTAGCGAAKSGSCASTSQPACCKPVIVRPCGPSIHTYQRKLSDIKPPCCDSCAPNGCCSKTGGLFGHHSGNGCAAPASLCGAGAGCAPGCAAPAANCVGAGNGAGAGCAPACAAPAAACAPAGAGAGCGPAASCAAPAANCAPAGPACAAPAANCGPASGPACAAPAAACAPAATSCAPATSCTPACGPKAHNLLGGGFLKGLFAKHNCASACAPACGAADPSCGAPAASSCTATESKCCNANPCDIAKLIYTSQTACYAKQRAAALRKLGNRYDCVCNPEIMSAFVYGLNDADERVRRTAADKIGDQIRENCCCCPEVVAALTCALADCDKSVRRQAEQALRLCGYDIVDGNCNTCSATGCTNGGCAPAVAPAAAPMIEPASPAPVPPMEKTGSTRKGHLSTLLGMRI